MHTSYSQVHGESKWLRVSRIVALCLIFSAASARSQTPVTWVDTTANPYENRLRQLVGDSAVIFSGQLLSLDRQPGPPAWTTAHFRVETAVKGAAEGLLEANFLVDAPGSFPMQPGERVVLFMHAPNAAGLTSLTAGGCGALERMGGDHVDLRRLQLCFAERVSASPAVALSARIFPGAAIPKDSPNMSTNVLLSLLEQLARETQAPASR